MATIRINLDDASMERLRQVAEAQGRSVEQLAAECLSHLSPPNGAASDQPSSVKDPIWGMFADDPELVDEMLANIMRDRERPWRLP